jgi:glutamate-1-semialdehyde 2,1-aminomutase/spore coat polysaccharide biosynthesis protein SpsF
MPTNPGAIGLALGTVQWGLAYGIANRQGRPTPQEVGEILARARAAGVTTLDTARAYGDSEGVIGEFIGDAPDWRIVTKLDPAAATLADAEESLRASRAALRRPLLDVVLLHRAHQLHADGGRIWNLLCRERDAGTIRAIGISASTPDEAWAALDHADVDCLQVACSLLDQRLSRREFFESAADTGRTVFVRSVFLQGAAYLKPAELPAHLRRLSEPLRAIRRWAADHQVSIVEAFLAFVARLAGVHVLVGCESVAQIEQNLRAWQTARELSSAVSVLVESVPALPAEVLDPSQWASASTANSAAPRPGDTDKPSTSDMTTIAIIQARMTSSRLPGKVLADIAGRPMLAHVVERTGQAFRVDRVVVATSDKPSDDPIARFCAEREVLCYRGDEQDVLDRFYRAAQAFGADLVVRITADCPLIDPAVVDRVVEALAPGVDYVSNCLRTTFPDGLDVEAFRFTALEHAWKLAKRPAEREHVTPYLRLSGKFTTHGVENDIDLSRHRWTVDEPADLDFVRRVYAEFNGRPCFGMDDVVRLLDRRPDLAASEGQFIANEGYYKSLYQQATAGPAPRLSLACSQELLQRSARVIPGTAQTFSKGRNQYVQGVSPVFLQRGKGCRVWDVDGNEYIDYVQGLLPNILGYAHDEVDAAYTAQLAEGHSFSLPHPLEVELAERLCRLIPCAEMVRFGKNGSDATAGAVRAARAFTGRERIACCGYHGWQDWYIGSTTRNAGVPAAVRALTHPFAYNDLGKLQEVLAAHHDEFAAVIMEPVNFFEPAPGYLAAVKELAHRHGALLIFDEICSGFHLGLGGAQMRFSVTPDLAAFGKAMGNGFPISCIAGRAEVMKTFEDAFVSFTFAGEVASMAAALKVLDILEHTDALNRLESSGRLLQDGFNALTKTAGLSDRLQCVGYPSWSLLKFKDAAGKDCLLTRSLFSQEVVKRGVLQLVTHNMTAAHDAAAVQETLEAYASVMKTFAGWLADANPARFLEGPMIEPVFRVR